VTARFKLDCGHIFMDTRLRSLRVGRDGDVPEARQAIPLPERNGQERLGNSLA
jgi:hypothetical protein